MIKNIFDNLPNNVSQEIFEDLWNTDNVRIERIISNGQASPKDFWYDQDWHEWVIVLQGRALLEFADDEKILELKKGDYVFIPSHQKHRVKWTDPTQETIWLAVHFYKANSY